MIQYSTYDRARALLVLVVFAAGGILGPVIHRAQHGLEWHHSKGSAADTHCDHSNHDVAFEKDLSDLSDEPCTICTVKPAYDAFLTEAFGPDTPPLYAAQVYVTRDDSRSTSTYDGRGPPFLS